MNGRVPFPDFLPVEGIVTVVFALIFVWWVVYTVVVIYHWLRYAKNSWAFPPMLIAHVVISGAIVLFIMS